MNLEDVIDPEYGLQQDEWSLSKPKFGAEGQLDVVGWSGKCWSNKLYTLRCNKCSEDGELFGDGYFRSSRSNLIKGQVPCGCSKRISWSEEQYKVICSRVASELGYTFIRFEGEWRGVHTKIKMLCEKHGEWNTGTIHNLNKRRAGCPMCNGGTVKPSEVMIASFFASGAFHPDTKFWRSDRGTSAGWKAYWFISCPICGEEGESTSSNLQSGKLPCACNMHHQQEAYINLISDDADVTAIKFGIANDSKQRIKQQDSKCAYTVKQHSIYTFPDVASCKAAERECKQTLDCGVVLRRDMPDGYSETTWVYNLDKIIEIYKKHGGVLKDE